MLVSHQVLEEHAPVLPDFAEREFTLLKLLDQKGRETLIRSAACCVVSSAWMGMRVTVLPLAI
jgi:hypothetical protein